jgi:hypothetical protein
MSEALDRQRLLASLVGLTGNVQLTLDSLQSSVMSAIESPIQLDREDIRRAIDAFTSGELSAGVLEQWAEAVHGAEGVVLDPADEAFLADALFELSSPQIFGSMEEIVNGIRERDGGLRGP